MVKKGNGTVDTLRSPIGQTAFTFDPTRYQAKYEAEMRQLVEARNSIPWPSP